MEIRFRTDLKSIMIGLGNFQKFDHGEKITELLPKKWNLQPGDHLNWDCAQFNGIIEVIKCEKANGINHRCTIKKIC